MACHCGKAILDYPTAFPLEREQHQANGRVANGPQGILGKSWDNGRVILSWDDVEKGARDFTDGYNVVLHEFAHQLDPSDWHRQARLLRVAWTVTKRCTWDTALNLRMPWKNPFLFQT
jgi:Mlc titration factor MtfA (ptsG expression regulator)